MYGSPVSIRDFKTVAHLFIASESLASNFLINESPTTTHWCKFKHCLLGSPLGLRICKNSSMSPCSISKLTDAAPLLTLPWFVAIIDESNILAQGTTPSDLPLPEISVPRFLIRDSEIPTPPPEAVNFISSALVKPIPRTESGVSIPKQDIGKPRSVPILDKTGDANPNHPFHISLKNLFSSSGFFNLEEAALATLLYAVFTVSPGSK